MTAMLRRLLPLLAVLALPGCSGAEPPRFPAACLVEPQQLRTALRAAPGDVRISGLPISTCVERAVRNDSALQSMGLLLTAVADGLVRDALDQGSTEFAAQLGFLTGAVRRGTGTDSGIAVELGRRVASSALELTAQPALLDAANDAVLLGRERG